MLILLNSLVFELLNTLVLNLNNLIYSSKLDYLIDLDLIIMLVNLETSWTSSN